MNDNSVALAAIALAGTLAAGFFKLLNKLSKSMDRNTRAHEVVAKTNKEIAKAVNKQSAESAERNGHLAELIIESKEQIISTHQHVDKQEVEHQTVKGK